MTSPLRRRDLLILMLFAIMHTPHSVELPAFAPGGPVRSSTLSLPSFARTTFARRPRTRTVSTTACFESSGRSFNETRTSSTAANSRSLARSDSETLPILAPMLGQNERPMSPSSFRVR